MASEIKQPRTTISILNADQTVQNTDQKVLFVGQQNGGTATSGDLQENILNDNSWDTLYGSDSILSAMLRGAREVNGIVRFDAIGLDDAGGGTDATGLFTITGTATEAGTLTFDVGSELNHSFDIAVSSGDTATVIGDALEAAITADANCPVDASNTTGAVTLTAVQAGTLGNAIGLKNSGEVAGVTAVVTTAMSGGATDPTLTGVFDIVGDNRYQWVVWPYADDVSELTGFLDPRVNVSGDVLDGSGITAKDDSLANHLSRLGALNSETLTEFCDKTESTTTYKGPAQFELAYVKSSYFAGIGSLRLTDDAEISEFVTGRQAALDAFGGAALASKPYFNTPISQLPLIDVDKGWTDTEIEQLHDAGGSVIGVNKVNSEAIVGEVVTTYKTTAAGNPDQTWKYMNYFQTATGIREYFFNNLTARFEQTRLTEGAVQAGRDMANESTVRAECEKLYQDLAGADFVLVEDGPESFKFFKDNLVITIDKSEGEVSIQSKVVIVTQLREIIMSIQIAFSVRS
jgi:phage tail sheath gpL-like